MSTSHEFKTLGLSDAQLSTLSDLGYESATPIQAQGIPALLSGNDLMAQAQTGSGKTATFALPIIAHLDLKVKSPQAIVIAPTRELAIQVAEAFQSYAKKFTGFHVLPIYGGQDFRIQLKALRNGVHVIVGTPGRVMDHLRRGTLSMEHLKTVILDEADEMLKMGFIDDIEWILSQIPGDHQTGLFSATIPDSIQKIADNYLKKNAEKILITSTQKTVDSIEQFFTRVNRNQKIEVLTRFLEIEDFDGAIIFTRTRNTSTELAEKLQARGHRAAALNGDMAQAMRKKVVDQIKKGAIDIIVATDVAARGIDVVRISHVINFDMPFDAESYIHRIGRTGRAGRPGKALLFISPREQRMLQTIEKSICKSILPLEPPSIQEMNDKRNQLLANKIVKVIEKSNKLRPYQDSIQHLIDQHQLDPKDIAAALAYLIQQDKPLPTQEIKSAKSDRDLPKGRSRDHNSSSRDRRRSSESFKKSGSSRSGYKKSFDSPTDGYKKSGSKRSMDSSADGRQRSNTNKFGDSPRSGYKKSGSKRSMDSSEEGRQRSSTNKFGDSPRSGYKKSGSKRSMDSSEDGRQRSSTNKFGDSPRSGYKKYDSKRSMDSSEDGRQRSSTKRFSDSPKAGYKKSFDSATDKRQRPSTNKFGDTTAGPKRYKKTSSAKDFGSAAPKRSDRSTSEGDRAPTRSQLKKPRVPRDFSPTKKRTKSSSFGSTAPSKKTRSLKKPSRIRG